MNMRALAGWLGVTCWLAAAAGDTAAQGLAFEAVGTNEFRFDTGVLRGKLHSDGKSKGLSSVVHLPSGMRLDASMGLFSHYRVFTANHRYGVAAWEWVSQTRLLPDGGVEVRWAAEPERPFELRAVYHWASADILDLETIVEAKAPLLKFESFLASYFAVPFTNCQVYVAQAPGRSGKGFLAADPGAGTWQTFPRDEAALPIIQDGRWKIEPNPVDWTMMPRLAAPLAFRRAPASGLTAVLMSPPRDCFAIFTPHQLEPHYSLYLSLFGQDLKAGETARARSRMVIRPKLSDAEIAKLYETFAGR